MSCESRAGCLEQRRRAFSQSRNICLDQWRIIACANCKAGAERERAAAKERGNTCENCGDPISPNALRCVPCSTMRPFRLKAPNARCGGCGIPVRAITAKPLCADCRTKNCHRKKYTACVQCGKPINSTNRLCYRCGEERRAKNRRAAQ